MSKRLLICALVLVLSAAIVGATQGKDGSWTGWVTDTHCGAKGDNTKHADCARKCVEGMGAKYALYNPTDKKVYILEPQDKLTAMAGKLVKVTGTVDGETIKFGSIEEVKGEKK